MKLDRFKTMSAEDIAVALARDTSGDDDEDGDAVEGLGAGAGAGAGAEESSRKRQKTGEQVGAEVLVGAQVVVGDGIDAVGVDIAVEVADDGPSHPVGGSATAQTGKTRPAGKKGNKWMREHEYHQKID